MTIKNIENIKRGGRFMVPFLKNLYAIYVLYG